MTLREHLNPFHVRHAAIGTALDVTDCVERLRADLVPWYVFWGVPQGMKGSAGENGFRVSRYVGARKSLPSQARGHFLPDVRGTRLVFEIGWRAVDLVGLSVAVAFLVAFSILVTPSDPKVAWFPWVVLPLMVLACVVHRLATYHDDAWLVQRLCEKLDGTEVPVSST